MITAINCEGQVTVTSQYWIRFKRVLCRDFIIFLRKYNVKEWLNGRAVWGNLSCKREVPNLVVRFPSRVQHFAFLLSLQTRLALIYTQLPIR